MFSLLAASLLLAGVDFIEVHGPDGQTAFVNIYTISNLREPTKKDLSQYFSHKVNCIIVTTNGKFISVTETCQTLHNTLVEKQHAK